MVEALHVIRALFARGIVKTARRPVVLTFSLLQPLVWMLLFGHLFGRIVPGSALGGLDYTSFVAPGVSLLAVLLGASQAGIAIVRDAQTGMLARMLQTRASVPLQLVGKLSADCVRLGGQALIVLAFGALAGATFAPDLAAVPVALLAAALFSVGAASLSCSVAAATRSPDTMGAYVHLVNMPLLFTSSALVPFRQLPEWLLPLARVNPMSIAARALRGACLSRGSVSLVELWGLMLFAGGSFAIASLALARARRA